VQLKQEQFGWKGAAVQKGLGPEGRGLAIVRSRYQATNSEDTADCKRLNVIL
jgi:phosphoserine aminotransferase